MRKMQIKNVSREEDMQKLKNEYFKQLSDNINTVADARTTEIEFAMAKKNTALKTGSKPSVLNETL